MGVKVEGLDRMEAAIKAAPQILGEEIIRALAYLGEQTVNFARDRSAEASWIDRTGNLRSSIGSGVFAQGQEVIRSTFEQVLGGTEGTQKGNEMLDTFAGKYAETYALVVVAAMEYAEFVERIETKDVLAGPELFARQKVEEYLQKATERAEKRIQELMG